MDNDKSTGDCACTQKLSDLAQAGQVVKKSSLLKIACVECGKVFWSNVKLNTCFNCTHIHGTSSNLEKIE